MNYLKVTFGIFVVLSASRLIPHPPNFTSLIALSFYVPALLGIRFLPALILCFGLTDLIIGFHETILFTWGSVMLIAILSKHFSRFLIHRIFGALTGALIFYFITNFGVWIGGSYGYTFEGLISCYILAIPFFGYSLISTFLFSVAIETVYKFFNYNFLIKEK